MGDVVPPQVELVADSFLGEHPSESPGGLQRPGRVLPLPLAADQEEAQLGPQPFEVVAVEVPDVVDRVVEVRLLAAMTPGAQVDGS